MLGLLAIVQIPLLRRIIGWLIDLLMGTIGQSYSLKNSAIRRSAVVQAAVRDLEWMTLKCRRISAGLKVIVDILTGVYATGKKYAADVLKTMSIIFDHYLPRGNYRAIPREN